MRRTTMSVLSALTAIFLIGVAAPQLAWASAWFVSVTAGSRGQSTAQPAPAAPATPTATCVSSVGNTVSVTWTAVAHATSYTVLQATASASGPYTVAATLSPTSWTSGALAGGNYWFQVKATIGTNWTSPASTATTQRTITGGVLCT
jgi:hypothetical protein